MIKPVLPYLLLASVSVTALSLDASSQATTTTADGEEARRLPGVVVTAEKREENLQTVPVAVSAISGEDFDRELIRDARDLQFSVPNFHVSQEQTNVEFTIRGVASSTAGATAFHRDGIFYANGTGAAGEYYDVERVEVLRGPQGTLFGRNSTAGAINVVSARATEDFGVGADVQVGDYDLLRARGFVNVPFSDKVKGRLAFSYAERDGYQENLFLSGADDDYDDLDEYAIRPQLIFNPTEQLEIQIIGESYRNKSNGPGGRLLASNEQIFDTDLDLTAFFPGLVIPDIYAVAGATPLPSDPRQNSIDYQDGYGVDFERDYITGIATLNLDAFGGSYVRVSANYTEEESAREFEADGTDAQLITAEQLFQGEQTSVEVLLGSDNDNSLQWVVGANYLSTDSSGFIPISLVFNDANGDPLSFTIPLPVDVNGDGVPDVTVPFDIFTALRGTGGNRTNSSELESIALFGQVDLAVTDRLSVTAGLRYTEDEYDAVFSVEPYPIAPALAPTANAVSYEEVSGKLGAEFRVDNNNFLYGSVSRGFNSSGFNATGTGPVPVDPEFIGSYEAGWKSTLFDQRLQLNTAIFLSDYTDLNITQVVGATSLTDTGDAEIFGLEAEFIAVPIDGLQIDGFVSFLDTELQGFDFTDPATSQVVSLSGNTLPRAPETQLAVGAQYEFNLGNRGTLTPRISTYYQDEIFFRPDNRPDLREGSFTKTDITLTWRAPSERFYFEGFVENLEDEQQVERISTTFAGLGAFPSATFSAPQTWGLRAGFRY